MRVRKLCAWCGEDMGDAVGDFPEGSTVTHGICKECLEAQERCFNEYFATNKGDGKKNEKNEQENVAVV